MQGGECTMTAASATLYALLGQPDHNQKKRKEKKINHDAVLRRTKINIPIPYLVYASPTPGRKSWHIIMKQK